MSKTYPLHSLYTELRSASADRERLYTANGVVDWATFALNPKAHREKIVEVTHGDFAFGTLRITSPCLLRLMEHVEFNPNSPRTWLDNDGHRFTGAWDSDHFSKAVEIDPDRQIDWFPSHSYQTDHPLPDGNSVPAWGDNIIHYLTGDVAHAYHLGFFAAIAVETEGVIIDLNGFTLRQHFMHALMQRFFAIIELADQPFPLGQGPATGEMFGSGLHPAHDVTIKNGELGRSSHHAIHGNECRNVLIENVKFHGHEVAAISLNGAKRVAIVDSFSLGSRQPHQNPADISQEGVPVLGTFSAARFEQAAAQNILAHADSSPTWNSDDQKAKTGFLAALDSLNAAVNLAFNEVIFQGHRTPSNVLFQNTLGLTDGPSYGILCSPRGVAVGPFMETRSGSTAFEAATDYYLRNVSMNAITIAPREIVSISSGHNDGNQVDIAGAVLQLFGLEGQPGCRAEAGTYAGTVLSDMQIRLAQAKDMFIKDDSPFARVFGTLSIEGQMVAWALAGHDQNYTNPFENGTPPYKLVHTLNELGAFLYLEDSTGQQMGYSVKIRCNGDSMHHVHKGAVAYRLDGVSGLYMDQCSANVVMNQGPKGSLIGGHYRNGSNGGHEGQGTKLFGYTGSDSYGIRLSACQHAILNHCSVNSIESNQGSGYGLYVSNDSWNILLNSCVVNSVKAGTEAIPEEPWQGANTVPQAFGFKTDSDSLEVTIQNCTVRGQFAQSSRTHEPRKVDLQGLDLQSCHVHGN